jgi:hypothetical protein
VRHGRREVKHARLGPRKIPRKVVSSSAAIPPISKTWSRRRWKLIIRKRWLRPQEHIDIKEARVVLIAIQRLSRNLGAHGRKVFGLSDSMVTICALTRGVRNPPLSMWCAAALALISWHVALGWDYVTSLLATILRMPIRVFLNLAGHSLPLPFPQALRCVPH